MQLDVFTVDVSDKTVWIFLRLTDADGRVGVGEATLNTRTAEVLASVPAAVEAVGRAPHSTAEARSRIAGAVEGVVGRVVASALEQAALDLEGQRCGRPVHALLGGAFRAAIPVYANINRGTLTRSAEEFADRAERAAGEGYRAVKLAPFDGVTADAPEDDARRALVAAGLERIAAVAARLGGRARLKVDCHSRFRPDEAEAAMREVAERGASWFEEPIAETAANRPRIAELRQAAGRLGLTLAGAEKCADTSDFLPFVVGGCYDTLMPDVILAGGPGEVVRIGHLAAALGADVSLHNPCGPVMDMVSIHAATALPRLVSVERQFEESPLYEDIVAGRAHSYADGAVTVGDEPGLGLALRWDHPQMALRARHDIPL